MGNTGNKLKQEKIKELHTLVPDMNIEEIKFAYDDFRRGSRGKKGLKLKDFVRVYTNAFGKEAAALGEHIFKAFDIDGDGRVTFEEFLIGLSVTDMKPGISRDSRLRKLKFFFEVYDTDRSGTIDRNEMRCIVRAVTGISTMPPEMSGKTPEQYADDLFDQVDLNGDGDITFEEFVIAADQNERLIDLILPVPPDDDDGDQR